jgi:hypothetical protein
MVWIEILGRPGNGTVADGQSVAVGARVDVRDATARRLVFAGQARVVEGPVDADPVVAQARARTR